MGRKKRYKLTRLSALKNRQDASKVKRVEVKKAALEKKSEEDSTPSSPHADGSEAGESQSVSAACQNPQASDQSVIVGSISEMKSSDLDEEPSESSIIISTRRSARTLKKKYPEKSAERGAVKDLATCDFDINPSEHHNIAVPCPSTEHKFYSDTLSSTGDCGSSMSTQNKPSEVPKISETICKALVYKLLN